MRLAPIAAVAAAIAAGGGPTAAHDAAGDAPLRAVSEARLRAHVRFLAADARLGRAPGEAGEPSTIAYIAGRFRAAGLQPAFAGRWFQAVPMVAIRPSSWRMVIERPGTTPLSIGDDEAAIYSRRRVRSVKVQNIAAVFAGYGISAPALGHDDYAAADVRGKAVVVLAGTPDAPAFRESDAPFRYGFGLIKAAEAARRGAAAVLILTPDGPAWAEASQTARARRLSLAGRPAGEVPRLEGRLRESAAQGLLGDDVSLAEWKLRAGASGFRAVPLEVTVTASLRNELRRFRSHNVGAVLPGTVRPSEHLVFLAHWDHLGVCRQQGAMDRVCNGAVDNASGVASLLEFASVLSAAGPMRRSVLFLATTGEEQGLLGASHYLDQPALPLSGAVAGAALDMTAGRSRGTDLVLFGRGLTDLDPIFDRAARAQGRTVATPRPQEASYLERSDNIVFLRRGTPVLIASGLWAEGQGREAFDRYEAERYHQPADELSQIPDFGGAAQDTDLLAAFARELANSSFWPTWSPASPFQRPPGCHPTAERGGAN